MWMQKDVYDLNRKYHFANFFSIIQQKRLEAVRVLRRFVLAEIAIA